jgi:DNA-directed RNA polymerase subunit M/transcription elongation factor TFIIS
MDGKTTHPSIKVDTSNPIRPIRSDTVAAKVAAKVADAESYAFASPEIHKKFYDLRIPLPIECYTDPVYNIGRCSRFILIGCCARTYPPFRELPREKQYQIIRRLERGGLNAACDMAENYNTSRNWSNPLFEAAYDQIMYKIQSHIEYDEKDTRSSYLITSIMDGKIAPEDVGAMKSHQMKPYLTSHLYEQIAERSKQKVVKKISTQYECSKCHNRRTIEESEDQLRALDEGSTLTILCVSEGCGHRWKMGGS